MAEKKQESFIVTDRRLFTSEGERRKEVSEEEVTSALLRPQEALALQWRHMRERTLLVEQALNRRTIPTLDRPAHRLRHPRANSKSRRTLIASPRRISTRAWN